MNSTLEILIANKYDIGVLILLILAQVGVELYYKLRYNTPDKIKKYNETHEKGLLFLMHSIKTMYLTLVVTGTGILLHLICLFLYDFKLTHAVWLGVYVVFMIGSFINYYLDYQKVDSEATIRLGDSISKVVTEYIDTQIKPLNVTNTKEDRAYEVFIHMTESLADINNDDCTEITTNIKVNILMYDKIASLQPNWGTYETDLTKDVKNAIADDLYHIIGTTTVTFISSDTTSLENLIETSITNVANHTRR